MKKSLVLILLILLTSCHGFNIRKHGLYECYSPISPSAPKYKFNYPSQNFRDILGYDTHIEFYDLNTNCIVQLRPDNLNYQCDCTPFETAKAKRSYNTTNIIIAVIVTLLILLVLSYLLNTIVRLQHGQTIPSTHFFGLVTTIFIILIFISL